MRTRSFTAVAGLAITLSALVLAACTKGSATARDGGEAPEALLLATVVSIDMNSGGGEFSRWVLKANVDAVLEGEFPDSEFTIGIHSPARSRLAVGTQARFRAVRSEKGWQIRKQN